MYELKSRAKIQLNKLKDEMVKKKKQGLSHFVEILMLFWWLLRLEECLWFYLMKA